MATRQAYQITGWRDSSNTAGRSGLGSRAEWPLGSGTVCQWPAAVSLRGLATHMCTTRHTPTLSPPVGLEEEGRGGGGRRRDAYIGLEELQESFKLKVTEVLDIGKMP